MSIEETSQAILDLLSELKVIEDPTTVPKAFADGLAPLFNSSGKPTMKGGITAYKYGGRLNAIPLLDDINAIDYAEQSGASVLLLDAIKNMRQEVDNFALNDIDVYPKEDQRFYDRAVDIPFTVAPQNKWVFTCFEDGIIRF